MKFINTCFIFTLVSVVSAQPPVGQGNQGGSNGKDGLNFFFWGDWGQNVPKNQSESGVSYEEAKVAASVTYYAQQMNPDFFCLLGDNFYENGVKNVTDPVSFPMHVRKVCKIMLRKPFS